MPSTAAAPRRPRAARWLGALLLTALAATAWACASEAGEPDEESSTATVERVVDGDTVRVVIDGSPETVRLVGIDTPETVAPGRPVECFGPEASARLAELLPPGEEVLIEADPTQDERDRYDRLLGYVYPEADREGESANQVLVESGHARAYVYGGVPFRDADEFMEAEDEAREAGRGLWGACEEDEAAETHSDRAVAGGEPASGDETRCSPSYGGCVPPPPPILNCSDLDGPIEVLGDDPHRLDGDGDGIACE